MKVKTYRVLKLITALATVLLLAALSLRCLSIYLSGMSGAGPVYTAEIVASALSSFVPFFILYILLVCAAVFAGEKAGDETKLPGLFADNRLRLAKKRFTVLPEAALREEKYRRLISGVSLAFLLGCGLPCILYMTKGEHFESWELEAVISQLLHTLVPWIAAAFVIDVVASFLRCRSMEREIEILKKTQGDRPSGSEIPKTKESKLMLPRVLIIAASIFLIVLGLMNGGAEDVFIKAINICTECIGLG